MGGVHVEIAQQAVQIPNSAYVIAGTLIVANVGTIFSLIYGIGKLVWFIAKLDARLEKVEGDVKAAHDRIRELRNA